jgi:hypothetical protein
MQFEPISYWYEQYLIKRACGMETEETSFEHVQKLVDQAESLRMQSVAVPLKDLQILLQICEAVIAQQIASEIAATNPYSSAQ